MDTSFWIRYNPNINLKYTTKQFYGQYLYKLVLHAPGGASINSKKLSVSVNHAKRLEFARRFLFNGFGVEPHLRYTDIKFLEHIQQLKKVPNLVIRIRVEEPLLQIYCNSEEELKQIVAGFDPAHHANMVAVHGPENAASAALLCSGAILRKESNGYQYRVNIRDGRYSSEVRSSILQYLTNLGDQEAHIPKRAVELLSKTSNYIWNLYFHVNDPATTTFINLIVPGAITNIHQLVLPPYK